MKKNQISTLEKVIKEMVSKEVTKQMKIVISEITNPAMGDAVDKVIGSAIPVNEATVSNSILNVKDPTLRKILMETQSSMGSEQEEYPTMGGSTYTSNRLPELSGNQMMQQETPEMPNFLKKAMSGHSAKVVKAMEKKHGTR